jgi:hypothetical protein
VGYHSYTGEKFAAKFAPYGVSRAAFPNVPIRLPNDRETIIRELGKVASAGG